jgi:hypothetical protein
MRLSRNGLFGIFLSLFVFSEGHPSRTLAEVLIVPFFCCDVDDLHVKGRFHLTLPFLARSETPYLMMFPTMRLCFALKVT